MITLIPKFNNEVTLVNNIINTITATIMYMYFERTSNAKFIPEYSTIQSDLSLAFDLATSKGIFFISVSIVMIYKKAKGNKAKNNEWLLPCLNTILRKLKVPHIKEDLNKTKNVDNL